jgi:hypothetical protein
VSLFSPSLPLLCLPLLSSNIYLLSSCWVLGIVQVIRDVHEGVNRSERNYPCGHHVLGPLTNFSPTANQDSQWQEKGHPGIMPISQEKKLRHPSNLDSYWLPSDLPDRLLQELIFLFLFF